MGPKTVEAYGDKYGILVTHFVHTLYCIAALEGRLLI